MSAVFAVLAFSIAKNNHGYCQSVCIFEIVVGTLLAARVFYLWTGLCCSVLKEGVSWCLSILIIADYRKGFGRTEPVLPDFHRKQNWAPNIQNPKCSLLSYLRHHFVVKNAVQQQKESSGSTRAGLKEIWYDCKHVQIKYNSTFEYNLSGHQFQNTRSSYYYAHSFFCLKRLLISPSRRKCHVDTSSAWQVGNKMLLWLQACADR